MDARTRLTCLRIALIVTATAAFGLYPLMRVWPSGWAWHSGDSPYPMMLVGIYATLGMFLLNAARDPPRHRSLILFTVWSSVVHGAIMTVQSIAAPEHRGHLLGDVPALFLIAIVLGALMPRASRDA